MTRKPMRGINQAALKSIQDKQALYKKSGLTGELTNESFKSGQQDPSQRGHNANNAQQGYTQSQAPVPDLYQSQQGYNQQSQQHNQNQHNAQQPLPSTYGQQQQGYPGQPVQDQPQVQPPQTDYQDDHQAHHVHSQKGAFSSSIYDKIGITPEMMSQKQDYDDTATAALYYTGDTPQENAAFIQQQYEQAGYATQPEHHTQPYDQYQQVQSGYQQQTQDQYQPDSYTQNQQGYQQENYQQDPYQGQQGYQQDSYAQQQPGQIPYVQGQDPYTQNQQGYQQDPGLNTNYQQQGGYEFMNQQNQQNNQHQGGQPQGPQQGVTGQQYHQGYPQGLGQPSQSQQQNPFGTPQPQPPKKTMFGLTKSWQNAVMGGAIVLAVIMMIWRFFFM